MYGTEESKLANEDAERGYARDPFDGIPNADDSLNGEFSPAKVTRPVRAYDITDRADRALMILVEAHDAGLPMPTYVTVSAHNHGDFKSSSVRFQFASDSEVSAWAHHFGRPFVSEKHGSSVTLEQSGQHDVAAYHYSEKPVPPPQPPMTDTMSGSYVPGLAEHTQAAPVSFGPETCTCPHPIADHSPKAGCRHLDCICLAGPVSSVPGLDAHTQAACDTITKASS